MYYYLNGTLAFCSPSLAVVDCGGVGYQCYISQNTYKEIQKETAVKLYTYLNVKEGILDLYGFAGEQEKLFFTLLVSVSGVGPKAAISILSEFTPEELTACILSSDVKRLTKASGIGAKTAQRICLEIKDKIAKLSVDISAQDVVAGADFDDSDVYSESVSILTALGYTKADAAAALRRCSADNANDLVRQALRILSSHL